MGLCIDLAQVLDGDHSVDLRRGHRGVTEQFLNHPYVGSALQHVCGKGMPQSVRAHSVPKASAFGCCVDRGPRTLARESSSTQIQEQCRCPLSSQRDGCTCSDRVCRDRVPRVAPERNDAFLAALAEQTHRPWPAVDVIQTHVTKLDVVEVEADDFTDSRAGTIENLQHRAIAQGCRSIPQTRPVSYTHLRAHETGRNLVCRLLLEK